MTWFRDSCIWLHVRLCSIVPEERWPKIRLRLTLLWFLPEILLIATASLFALVVGINFLVCWITGDWKSWDQAIELLKQFQRELTR